MPNSQFLQDILHTAREGADFYNAARQKTQSAALAAVFLRLAQSKQNLITELSAALMAKGKMVPAGGSLSVAARKVYADVRASLSSDEDAVYVGELEEVEDRLMSEMKTALAEVTDPLQQMMLHVSSGHAEMRDLKHSMAA